MAKTFVFWCIAMLILTTALAGSGVPIQGSSNPFQLAIDGEGWFVLRDRESGRTFYTRYGGFSPDMEGYLWRSGELRLQGILRSNRVGLADLPSSGGEVFAKASEANVRRYPFNMGWQWRYSDTWKLLPTVPQVEISSGTSVLTQFLGQVQAPSAVQLTPMPPIPLPANAGFSISPQMLLDLGRVISSFDRSTYVPFGSVANFWGRLDLALGASYVMERSAITVENATWYGFERSVAIQRFLPWERLYRVEWNLYSMEEGVQPELPPTLPGENGAGSIFTFASNTDCQIPQLNIHADFDKAGPHASGEAVMTANPTDMAIQGPGFFLVRDPNSSELFATRAGMFVVDAENYLVTVDRRRVQGYVDAKGTIPGDIRVRYHPEGWVEGDPFLESFRIQPNGQVDIRLSNDDSTTVGFIRIFDLAHPKELNRIDAGYWKGVLRAAPVGVPVARLGGVRWIASGRLESIQIPSRWLEERSRWSVLRQGAVLATHDFRDLMLLGEGFFLLRDPVSNQRMVTRRLSFRTGPEGHVESLEGWRVQFWDSPTGTNTSDLRLPGRLSFLRTSYADGGLKDRTLVRFECEGGMTNISASLAVCAFRESFQLRKQTNGLLGELDKAFLYRPLPGQGTPLKSGCIEAEVSDVELIVPPRRGVRIGLSDVPPGFELQSSTDLKHWKCRLTVQDQQVWPMEFVDPENNGSEQMFYRIVNPAGLALTP